MKPFKLEAAKRGEPIITRDGTSAKFIAHVPEAAAPYRVIVMISGRGVPSHHYEDGRMTTSAAVLDLFMRPRKRTVYVNLYSEHLGGDRGRISRWFDTAKHATDEAKTVSPPIAVAVPIEIEE